MKGNNLLKDKIIFIAGAASHVGKDMVSFFLCQGATVIAPVINERGLNILKQLADRINTGRLVTQLADLPDYDDAFDIAKATIEKFGKVDIGISVFKYTGCDKQLSNALISDWIKMLDEDLNPFFISALTILHSMKQSRGGMFVSICDNIFFEKDKPAPFSKITAQAKMEISRIFVEEIKPYNIKYRHLWVNMDDINKGNALEKQDADAISRHIMSMYFDKTVPGNVFQQLA